MNLSPEELKELIKTTIEETKFIHAFILTLLPVFFTITMNIIYDIFRRKNDFIKNYKIEELKNLYLPLYCMICQSEYIRKIINDYTQETKLDINVAPYLHIEKNQKKLI